MKYLTIATLSFFTLVSCSHKHKMHHDWNSLTFDQAKSLKLDMLDRKAKLIADGKTCVNAAKNKDDLEVCHKKMHEKKKDIHKDMKEKIKKKS